MAFTVDTLTERDIAKAIDHSLLRPELDDEFVEGATGPLQGLLAGGARDDQLGEHRVERAGDLAAGLDPGVPAHAGAVRHLQALHRAGRGHEVAAGVLGVDAELDAVPARLGVLGDLQLLAGGDAELLADQVDAGRLLADRVLHLQAGVDLEEGDRAVGAHEVLDGAGAVVAGLGADGLGRGVDPLALLVGEERRGRLLDELLVAPLQRAVAGADDDDVAVGVGQHLRLDVPRLVEEPLHEALAAAEGRDRLADGGVEQLRDLLLGAGHLEAAAATTEGGLDGHGQPVLLGEGDDLVGATDGVLGSGDERGAGLRGDVPRLHLVAERDDRLGGGADPGQPRVDHRPGEIGVLGQEPVAGVDRVRARLLRRVDDLLDHQVGVAGRRPPEGEGLVGHPDVQGVAVGLGVDGHARQPLVLARAGDAHRDLAAVGDQDLLHRCSPSALSRSDCSYPPVIIARQADVSAATGR